VIDISKRDAEGGMRRSLPAIGFFGMLVLTLLAIFLPVGSHRSRGAVAPNEALALSGPQDCIAPDTWFPVTQEYDYVNTPIPQEDCDFYKFAWQTFLFVTQPVAQNDPRAAFTTYKTPADVFNATHLLGMPSPAARGDLVLTPRLRKPTHANSLDGVQQATSKGVLVDQNGRAVYYGLHINDAFVDFVKGKNKANLDLTNPTNIMNAPADDLQFTPGCLELKSSWRVVAQGEDASNYYTTTATLPTLKMQNNQVIVDNSTPIPNVKVALVGLHVVGVVNGHPEFIWATFEHVDNAPDLPVGVAPHSTLQSPAPDRDWTFCPKGTMANLCNQNPNGDSKNPLQLVDPTNQILSPKVPIYRLFAFGGDDPRAIISLSTTVHERLPKERSVWKNYELIGATWVADPSTSFKSDPNANGFGFNVNLQAGATQLSNSTMETFTQDVSNCFGCHNTAPVFPPETNVSMSGSAPLPAKRINVSHVITNAFFQVLQFQSTKPAPEPAKK
jgi:hypothetical protein